MEGLFLAKKKANFWLVLLLLCGTFFVILWLFLRATDESATEELHTLWIIGVLCALVSIPSMLLNFGAYFRIENDNICAKHHWFGKLNCGINDVEFVLPQINTLTILLKNGKCHTIMGIENSWELASAIRRKAFRMETESPDVIMQELDRMQAARKKEILWTVGATVLMFVNIFVAIFLTDAKDMHEFSQLDWIAFAFIGFVELLTVVALFYIASRCAKRLLPVRQLKHRLYGAIIATTPLPTNNTTAVFTDENYSGRVVVCGFPNDKSVYYCVQEFTGDMTLETTYTSEIFESKEDLPLDHFANLIDISPTT